MTDENYQTYPISPKWTIRAERYARGFTLSDYEKERIESLWSQETRLHPQTFNGQILNVISFNESGMVGEFVDYKFYIVQRLDPNLRQILNIRSLAVSGVTQHREHERLDRSTPARSIAQRSGSWSQTAALRL